MTRSAILGNVAKWNKLAGRVPCTFPLDWVLSRTAVNSKDSVLDYGCGEGRLLEILSRAGITGLWGCDSSERMCNLAKSRNPYATIIQSDLTEPGSVINHSFSLITSIAVLSSIVPRLQRMRLVRALWSMLSPGGRIVIADFGAASSREYKEKYLNSVCESRTFRTSEGLYIHHFRVAEIVQLLKACSFDILETETISTMTMHGNRIPGHIVFGKRRA
jgi:2-polyprenyl-3-methyl-5-hydroxy-6-metoxy-1,4-benzoquinol methylase